ncbi:glycosyltransferase [Spirosoma utsteinense]|uniref:Cellulose synthase/poly-beta-1,6-N-acetylglucosamine synthase-like glycosyltransferase n=1 Tax=Spirosoma utsteinense TaxID=2585773 RepID=A0ABR6WC37_9BACT|nr:glycosyltransferase [Spirosoma utsteinense]MBC3785699.1 cellulose synthase/poly-beta-1,6-N-acetylglucosamine synthase-like glycosyltransferase [Spirosoma utsteinense]MBC3793723.1 cellulose synthase/poly-beta-1,6-N-acetylglucosamine synthase-like glycosyltransferase [Spirosoma utsteinense]
MISILILISALYALFTLLIWVTWLRMPAFRPVGPIINGPTITVIIPVRNEAASIGYLLDDLSRQSYDRFTVIVADDSSTDATLAICQAYARRMPYALHPLPLTDERSASPKKRAISQSIALATGELIVTTDGDCRVGPDWLASMAAFYQETGAKLISGPVTFAAPAGELYRQQGRGVNPGHTEKGADRPYLSASQRLFALLQTVEFASLIGSGACTMALGKPTMCNGANLCYQKRVFTEVGGFAGVDHLASGDDEFLMHKVAARYPTGVHFLKSRDAIVSTQAHLSLSSFYQQRKRWASKWKAYESWLPSVLAVFIFLSNAAPVVAVGGWLLGFLDGNAVLAVMALKGVTEFLFLRQILVFLQKKPAVAVIPLTQLLYPFYVVFFGLAAQGKGYQWKGRNLK